MVKEIVCIGGKIALCDDEHYPLLSKFKWYMGSNLAVGGYPCCFVWGKNATYKRIFMHQLVAGGATNIDHIDQDKMNNQSSNLRIATHQENGWNKGRNKTATGKLRATQYKGVCKIESKTKGIRWRAQIMHVERGAAKGTGKMIYVGYYATEIEAARAYNKKVRELRGEFAWVNPLPDESPQSQAQNR